MKKWFTPIGRRGFRQEQAETEVAGMAETQRTGDRRSEHDAKRPRGSAPSLVAGFAAAALERQRRQTANAQPIAVPHRHGRGQRHVGTALTQTGQFFVEDALGKVEAASGAVQFGRIFALAAALAMARDDERRRGDPAGGGAQRRGVAVGGPSQSDQQHADRLGRAGEGEAAQSVQGGHLAIAEAASAQTVRCSRCPSLSSSVER